MEDDGISYVNDTNRTEPMSYTWNTIMVTIRGILGGEVIDNLMATSPTQVDFELKVIEALRNSGTNATPDTAIKQQAEAWQVIEEYIQKRFPDKVLSVYNEPTRIEDILELIEDMADVYVQDREMEIVERFRTIGYDITEKSGGAYEVVEFNTNNSTVYTAHSDEDLHKLHSVLLELEDFM